MNLNDNELTVKNKIKIFLKNMSKKVYIGMSADVFHHGHVNIISEARKYGDVYIGLLNDKAVADYKRLPYLSWDKRKIIFRKHNRSKRSF